MAPVTDPVLLKELIRQGINPADVDFDQDYAPRSLGKRHGPYAKFYRGLLGNARGKQWMVVSGLSMVDCDGIKCEPKWVQTGNTYHTKSNVFAGLVNDIPGRITLTVKNDDAFGRKKNDRLVFIPQLFLNGVEVPRPNAVLLPVDPLNSNYLENTIEWDYGMCKRRLRQIEGCVLGSWVFPVNPVGDVSIKYNQTGDYKVRLGHFKVNDDEELIPASVFNNPETVYPFTVSDSATYNPDADPETTSVDGIVTRDVVSSQSWADIRDGAGNDAYPSHATGWGRVVEIRADSTSPYWRQIVRSPFLFDTSGLPDGATISEAILSLYGYDKADIPGWTLDINIYSSNPASNTDLVAADYNVANWGSTTFATTISYANWSTVGYNDFNLNASGIAAISKTAVSKFGARNANYDVANTAPSPWSSAGITKLSSYFSEQGAGYKPKLVVTYTLATRGWMSK